MNISVITPTRDRPGHAALCCEHFHAQSCKGLTREHLIISDGECAEVERVARYYSARYLVIQQAPTKDQGNRGRDWGISHALGEYVAFWDDDNAYYPHSLATQFAAAYGVGIGITRVWHRQVGTDIPELPYTGVRFGNVDTACLCVRIDLARRASWSADIIGRNGDWCWLQQIMPLAHLYGGQRFVPIITAAHL